MKYVHRCRASQGGLLLDGPLVEARLSPPKVQADQLSRQGKKVPSVAAVFMIDTGAGKTAIDNTLAAKLDLVPVRYDQYDGPSGIVEMQIKA